MFFYVSAKSYTLRSNDSSVAACQGRQGECEIIPDQVYDYETQQYLQFNGLNITLLCVPSKLLSSVSSLSLKILLTNYDIPT